jgi:glutathione S-transferase
MMHSWRIALELSGVDRSNIAVTQLAYASRSTWPQVIPTGAGLPFLRCRDADVLYGAVPVLQYFAETVGSQLLPANPVERVHVRNRALMAIDILSATRPVLVAANNGHLQNSLNSLFAVLQSAENQSWSSLPALDAVLLAAAATVLCSQPQILEDARWSSMQTLLNRLHALSEHPVVLATRAQNYRTEFSEFFASFGSMFAAAS